MYLMPKIGTRISLYFSNEDETSAKAINCVRTNGGTGAGNTAMTAPQDRQLLTEHGKQLYLYADSMGFTAGEQAIRLSDATGILFRTPKHIALTAAQSIHIKSKEITIEAKIPAPANTVKPSGKGTAAKLLELIFTVKAGFVYAGS